MKTKFKKHVETTVYVLVIMAVLCGLYGGAKLFPLIPERYGNFGAAFLPLYIVIWVSALFCIRGTLVWLGRRVVRHSQQSIVVAPMATGNASIDQPGRLFIAATLSILPCGAAITGLSAVELAREASSTGTVSESRSTDDQLHELFEVGQVGRFDNSTASGLLTLSLTSNG